MQLSIGIDIGGTSTKLGVVDEKGNVLAKRSISTQQADLDQYLDHLAEAIEIALEHANASMKDVRGVGIGAPNANGNKGTIEHAPNLLWKGIVPFVEMFRKRIDVPTFITNDANAAAIGEMVHGGAKGMKDFIIITMGTGLGAGIVSNGQLVQGVDGFAAELGHVNVNFNGRYCGCGKRGCLETYVSATGIVRTVYKLLADFRDPSEMRSISFDRLSAKMITQSALRGDKIAIEAYHYTGRILGIKLADTVAHTNPEAIFLLGGLANAGKLIFDPTKEYMEQNLMPIFKNKIKLLPSGLDFQDASIIGASSLVQANA
jgi:glucokinase